MPEHEPLESIFPVESKPSETAVWINDNVKPLDLADCDRIRVDGSTVEIDRGRETVILDPNNYNLSIACPYTRSMQNDQAVSYFDPHLYLSIETCPN